MPFPTIDSAMPRRAIRYFLLLLLPSLFFLSCQDDDELSGSSAGFEQGVFITHEGPFQQGTGTVFFYDTKEDNLHKDIFQAANNGQVLGNIVQSMHIHNDRAYVVVNNANRIEVVDAGTFKSIGSIEGLSMPRQLVAVSPDRAFVSQWGLTGTDGSIAVVDLNHLTVLKTIPCGSGPEDLLIRSGKVYVANSGGFGNDSTVVVIDVSKEEVETTLSVGDNPTSFEIDKNGQIWVICRGIFDFMEPANNTNGQLIQIEDTEIVQAFTAPNGANRLVINQMRDVLFVLLRDGILAHPIQSSNLNLIPIHSGFYYGLGLDAASDLMYAANAGDFQSPGEIIRLTTAGVVVDTLEAGIIPGSFEFKSN